MTVRSGLVIRQPKRGRVTPRHIMLGVRKDEELNRLLADNKILLAEDGVLPHLEPCLTVSAANWRKQRVAANRRDRAHLDGEHLSSDDK